MSNLMLHAGGRVATLDEVRNCQTPAAVGRWHPTSHAAVLDSVRETLTGAGYVIRAEKYALARNDHRFFGVLDLATPLVAGVSLAVGVRNSASRPVKYTPRFSVLDCWPSSRPVGLGLAPGSDIGPRFETCASRFSNGTSSGVAGAG